VSLTPLQILLRCQGHHYKISSGVIDTAKKFSLVSLTPLNNVKSLLPLFRGVLDTTQKFSTGINDTSKDFLAVSLTPAQNFKT